MSNEPISIPVQIEADKRLLSFDSYEDYLDNFLSSIDECYLENPDVCRIIAELGYRNAGETLTRYQFEKRVQAVINYHLPSVNAAALISTGITKGNKLQLELAQRERSNRVGILSTIIYLRPVGSAHAGYIDYADRLNSGTNWKQFFHGNLVLRPKKSDLCYYNWKTGIVLNNNSANYTILYSAEGLAFRNRFDRQKLNPEPYNDPGGNYIRREFETKVYGRVIFFDHVVRQRI